MTIIISIKAEGKKIDYYFEIDEEPLMSEVCMALAYLEKLRDELMKYISLEDERKAPSPQNPRPRILIN